MMMHELTLISQPEAALDLGELSNGGDLKGIKVHLIPPFKAAIQIY